MGKSWKERPNKWRHQLNKKHKNQKKKGYSPFQDPPEFHQSIAGHDPYDNSIGGPNDYAYGM